jgi:hypothetical protein
MAPRTLQSLISDSGAGSGDLSPLAANTTFERAVNAELTARDAAATAAEKLAARTDDLASGVATFSGAMRALRAVSKRYPETSKFIDEAVKQVQLSMGAVAYNPQPLPGEKGAPATTPATPATPTPLTTAPLTGTPKPLPTVNVTGQPPVAAPPFRPPSTEVKP